MILHLKSPNVICINQQSDLLMYSSGLFQRHIVSHIKMEGTPPPPTPVLSTQLTIYIKKKKKNRLFSAALHPLLQNGAIVFTYFGELMLCFRDFLFCYVRYYLSLVTRKPVFGVFAQLRFNLVCSATAVS